VHYAGTQPNVLRLTFLISSARPPNNTLTYFHVVLLHKIDYIKEDIEKGRDILHSIVTGLSLNTGGKQ